MTLKELEDLQEFFDQTPAVYSSSALTRQHYIDLSETIVSFFNEYNPEDYDLRDARKCRIKLDELIDEEIERLAYEGDWNNSNQH